MRENPGSHPSMKSPKIKALVLSKLAEQGIPAHTPCLKLEVVSNDRLYNMLQSDVRSLLSVFGEINSLRLLGPVVLVLFEDITSAFFA